ncbi:MAG: hypothetical protein NTZ74_07320 [Chloroflexi bacterium]|nr:hypothetical protein [Chloroflexota bacterium]
MDKPSFFDRIRFIGSEFVLGTLVAVLSILTAISGFQASQSDSSQMKYNVQGQQKLTDANAEYLTANQLIVYDYSLYDGWYTAETVEKEDYYLSSFSDELTAAIDSDEEDPFSDAYYDAMYVYADDMFEESDDYFITAEEYDEQGTQLQLVMMIMALGLAFGAWASLLNQKSKVRLIFAVLSIGMLVYGIVLYLNVPTVMI